METDFLHPTLRALRRLLRVTELGGKQLAAVTGLTTSQLMVLQEVDRGGEVMPSAVAHALQFSQATITTLVDRLVAVGLVTRQRSDLDKRRMLLRITDEGRSVLNRAPDMLQDRFGERYSSLPEWEQAMILAGLERLSELLGASDIDAAPLLDSGPIDRGLQG
ncbi:MarR family transcriptional regulator [Novosphingobium endophyticum]|uniref:MarR family transcriptional regulator n=1 Tax=Novosphingobium endophyticum TaxID=1955250 RepID=A0A916TWQ0_9SPHN|nr:MarR family winged helix-turn-helix transcriptional regulator [Novosphingobium endophyticum]GGC08814.1 MarR family transcriptional regulator [Novosphingobium endophyticum]